MSDEPKQMPQSEDSEVALLGAMLMDHKETINECLAKLHVEHFYQRRHKIIFYSISKLSSENLPVNPQTVLTSIDSKDLELSFYLSKIATCFPSMSHVQYYISELKQKHRLRNLLELGADINLSAWNPSDINEYINSVEKKFYDLAEDRQDDNLLGSSHVQVMDLLGKLESGEGLGAIKTGLSAIDDSIMGVVPGMMDVYAAEAGCGKTSMVEMIALKMLQEEKPVLIFQRDMTPAGFYFRLACRMAGVTVSQLRKHYATMKDEIETVKYWATKLSKTPLLLYSPDGCTGQDVRAIARRESRKSGIKAVIVDHIRTLRHSKQTSWDGLEENSGYIRQSTNETGIAHIVLAHINREGAKSERPTISHIKGGDQLKDDSDNCCVMWCTDGKPNLGTGEHSWKVSFAFDKCRWDWSAIQTMNYNGPKMRFETIRE